MLGDHLKRTAVIPLQLGITKLLFKSTSVLLEKFPPSDSMFTFFLNEIAQPEQKIVLMQSCVSSAG